MIILKIEFSLSHILISLLKKSSLKRNIRDITTILSRLSLVSLGPPAHALTISEVSKYFDKNKEPTKDDEFAETIRESLHLWPSTSFFENGEKLKDSFLEVAIEKLSERPDYIKTDGELNISKISKMLGIDDKTVKDRL